MPPYGNHGGIIRKSVLSAVIVQMYLIIIKGVSISISSEATYICKNYPITLNWDCIM